MTSGPTTYTTVFDVTDRLPELWFPAAGILFVLIGIGLWYSAGLEPAPVAWTGPFRTKRSLRRGFAGFWLGFSILWTVTTIVGVLGSYWHLSRALRNGTAQVVEGRVEQFEPMPYEGHARERFAVDGVHFAYSDYNITSAFNNTSSHGGPIREGLLVRIHYVGSTDRAQIVRLEVAEPPAAARGAPRG